MGEGYWKGEKRDLFVTATKHKGWRALPSQTHAVIVKHYDEESRQVNCASQRKNGQKVGWGDCCHRHSDRPWLALAPQNLTVCRLSSASCKLIQSVWCSVFSVENSPWLTSGMGC